MNRKARQGEGESRGDEGPGEGRTAPPAGRLGHRPNGVIVRLKAPAEATLTVETEQGKFTVPLADLADGATRRYLDGKVEAQRVPTARPAGRRARPGGLPRRGRRRPGGRLGRLRRPPAARAGEVSTPLTRAAQGASPTTSPTGGGDQVRLVRFADGKRRRRRST